MVAYMNISYHKNLEYPIFQKHGTIFPPFDPVLFWGKVRPVLRKAWHENDGDLPTPRAKNARAGRGSPGELLHIHYIDTSYHAHIHGTFILICIHNDIRFIIYATHVYLL